LGESLRRAFLAGRRPRVGITPLTTFSSEANRARSLSISF